MQELTLPKDRCRERRGQVSAAVELLPSPHQHVLCHAQALQGQVRSLCASEGRKLGIGYDNHEVVVAVRGGVAACPRAKQVDTLRLKQLGQTPNRLTQTRVVDPDSGLVYLGHALEYTREPWHPSCYVLDAAECEDPDTRLHAVSPVRAVLAQPRVFLADLADDRVAALLPLDFLRWSKDLKSGAAELVASF